MNVGKWRRWTLYMAVVMFAVVVMVGALLVTTSKNYFDHRLDRQYPVWVSDLFLKGRRFLGQFREPPSNDEMIHHFHAHEAEFEKLVADYYSINTTWHDHTHDLPHPDRVQMLTALRFQMAELGAEQVLPGGPGFATSVYGRKGFQDQGMKLYLFDRGGSLSEISDGRKGYAYAPRLTDQTLQSKPILNYLNTGQYGLSSGLADFCKKREIDICCGMAVINANWAVTTCNHTPTH